MYLDRLRIFWLFYPVTSTHNFFVSLGLTIVAMSVTHKFGSNCVSSVVKTAIPGDNGESMGTKLQITKLISYIAEYNFMFRYGHLERNFFNHSLIFLKKI